MATLKNKRELAAVAREDHEERPKKSQSRDTVVFRFHKDYIT